jgi:hypothetical protein
MTGRKDATFPSSITLKLPLTIRQRGGRKIVITPTSPGSLPTRTRTDNTLIKAVARAHRWKNLLERGDFASVRELAAAEEINESYVCRVLRLTLLSPELTESILDGRQRATLDVRDLLKPFPADWLSQTALFG